MAVSTKRARTAVRVAPADWVGALEGINPSRLAAAIAACITVLAALGAANIHWPHQFKPFNLDHEFNFPATFSALLDLSAAVGAEALRRRAGKNVLLGLVVLFAFMAFDEFSALHEHLERVTGIDWLKLYIPIFIFAGVAWVAVLNQIRERRFWICMWGGAACWVIAQFLELVEWDGTVKQPHYYIEMAGEEVLEMIGSALFLLGMLTALRAWERRSEAPF